MQPLVRLTVTTPSGQTLGVTIEQATANRLITEWSETMPEKFEGLTVEVSAIQDSVHSR
jgi:hypothetical protein